MTLQPGSRPPRGALLLGGLALVSMIAGLPYIADRGVLHLGAEMALYLSLAVMWNLLAGYAGIMSIGQQAYVGIGGYVLFVLSGTFGVFPLIAIPLAGVLAAVIAIPVCILLFRLSGPHFAIASWVMAEIFMLAVAQTSSLGGGSGMSLPADQARAVALSADARASIVWWLASGLASATLLLSYAWLRLPGGLALMAMRDNEVAAETLGVSPMRQKLVVYVLAALCAGLVGAIAFFVKLRISPSVAFDVNEWTANIIFIVVIGGLGHFEGAIVGTLIFFILRGALDQLGAWYLMILGAIAIAVMIKAPGGVWGVLHDRYGIEIFPLRRRIG